MGTSLEIIKIGSSAGVILPEDLLAYLGVGEGDMLSIFSTPGGITLRRSDDEFDRQMKIARDVMRRHRGALRELAKGP